MEQQVQDYYGQSHVVVLGQLGAGLILVQTELLLGFLKHALNPITLYLPVEHLPHPER